MNTLEYLQNNRVRVNPILTQMFRFHINIDSKIKCLTSLNTYPVSVEFENLIWSLIDSIHYKLDEWYETHRLIYFELAKDMGLIDKDMDTRQRIQAMQYAKYKTELTTMIDKLIVAVELLELDECQRTNCSEYSEEEDNNCEAYETVATCRKEEK